VIHKNDVKHCFSVVFVVLDLLFKVDISPASLRGKGFSTMTAFFCAAKRPAERQSPAGMTKRFLISASFTTLAMVLMPKTGG
jgi:hypothetical protein